VATYIVTYNAGTSVTGITVPANQTKIYDVALTLSTGVPTRTGYAFAGWNTSADGTGMSYASGASYTDNVGTTLYAQWTANTYTVIYNAGIGVTGVTVPANQTKIYDVALTLNSTVPTRTGYTFARWSTSDNGTGTFYASGESYTANAAVTLYAQWTVNTYTVAYNANNGTGAPDNQTKTHDVALTLSTDVPTRTGYTFASWNTSANGSGISYASGTSYTANAGTTLYAQWSSLVVSNCDGQAFGTVVIGTQTWMAENLNCNVSGSKCYNNSEYYCDTYGRRYDWVTAMVLPNCTGTCSSQIGTKHRGICPEGWHIPSDAEWTTLTDFIGSSTAGTKLKATSSWISYPEVVPSGTDTYGFAALPGGYNLGAGFDGVGTAGFWWSATEYNTYNAYRRGMIYLGERVDRGSENKSYSLSVRCLED
jgi:uncharacterized protein (TIGR02145 family)/uncharacterized repeat protein (TIGR02543 family)